MSARIGSMVAPFIITLKVISDVYPPIIFGVVPIVGAALVLLLPETQGLVILKSVISYSVFGTA